MLIMQFMLNLKENLEWHRRLDIFLEDIVRGINYKYFMIKVKK